MELNNKRLFLSLLVAVYGIVVLVGYGAWKLTYLGLESIMAELPMIAGAVLGVILLEMGIGVANVFVALKGWYIPPAFRGKVFTIVNMLYPMLLMLGKVLRIDKRRIEASFVTVSNQIVNKMNLKVSPDKLLVVTPHCLQLATCPHKITRDPFNCKRCGACDIAALVNMAEEIGFHFFVVTGGTLARQTVYKIRPKVVLAIACERDLASGVQDVYPLPAVGVMNIRPNGPCYNTKVDVEEFRRQLENVLDLPPEYWEKRKQENKE